jgi:hypothetical protein
MAMMLAPLSLNHPAAPPTASGGTGPFSGGVAQNILPWNWFSNFTGNKLPRDTLTDDERAAVEDFSSQMREIKRIKEKRRE